MISDLSQQQIFQSRDCNTSIHLSFFQRNRSVNQSFKNRVTGELPFLHIWFFNAISCCIQIERRFRVEIVKASWIALGSSSYAYLSTAVAEGFVGLFCKSGVQLCLFVWNRDGLQGYERMTYMYSISELWSDISWLRSRRSVTSIGTGLISPEHQQHWEWLLNTNESCLGCRVWISKFLHWLSDTEAAPFLWSGRIENETEATMTSWLNPGRTEWFPGDLDCRLIELSDGNSRGTRSLWRLPHSRYPCSAKIFCERYWVAGICRVTTDKSYPGGNDCEKIGNCGKELGV